MKRSGVVVIILALLAGSVWLLRQGKLTLAVWPEDSSAQLEGKSVASGSRLRPGQYQLAVSHDGYVPTSQIITIKPLLTTSFALHLRRIPEPKPLAASGSRGNWLVTSQTIRFLTASGRYIVQAPLFSSPDGSRLTTILSTLNPPADDIQFSPDGFLALIRRSGAYSLFSFDRRDLLHQTERKLDDSLSQPIWSFDGKQAAAIQILPSQPLQLQLFDSTFEHISKSIVLPDIKAVSRLRFAPDGGHMYLVADQSFRAVDLLTKEVAGLSSGATVTDFLLARSGLLAALSIGGRSVQLVNVARGQLIGDSITTTLTKTAFDNQNHLLAAVPKTGNSDQLMRVDTAGRQTPLFYTATTTHHPDKLLWPSANTSLYFESGQTLWSVDPEAPDGQ